MLRKYLQMTRQRFQKNKLPGTILVPGKNYASSEVFSDKDWIIGEWV